MEVRYVLVRIPIAHVAPNAHVNVGVIGQADGQVRGRFAADEVLYALVHPMIRHSRFKYLQEIFDRVLQKKTLTTTQWEGDQEIAADDPRYLDLLRERWSDGHVVFSETEETIAESLDEGLETLLTEQVLKQQIETTRGLADLVLSH